MRQRGDIERSFERFVRGEPLCNVVDKDKWY